MDVLSDAEVREIVSSSKLVNKYNTEMDRESAYELLNEKLAEAEEAAEKAELQRKEAELKEKEDGLRRKQEERESRTQRSQKSTFERVATSSVGTTIVREVTRGILGVLGLGGGSRSTSTRKRSKPGWW